MGMDDKLTGKGNSQLTWGPVFDDDVIRINFPNSTDWVDVKRYITEQDDSIARDAASTEGMKMLGRKERRGLSRRKGEDNTQEMQYFFKQGVYTITLLSRIIRVWSFSDKTGTPIPVTPDTIGRLPGHTRDFIFERVDELNPGINEEDEEDEESGSGGGSDDVNGGYHFGTTDGKPVPLEQDQEANAGT